MENLENQLRAIAEINKEIFLAYPAHLNSIKILDNAIVFSLNPQTDNERIFYWVEKRGGLIFKTIEGDYRFPYWNKDITVIISLNQ